MNYDKDLLDDMCRSINLLEYAQNSMEFKPNGNDSFVTHCPLHKDLTPSLSICPSKNMFHCFSCGKGGTILNWLMVYEHMNFNDAVTKVGHLSGRDIKQLKQCDCMREYKTIKRLMQNTTIKSERQILDSKILDKYSDEVPNEWLTEGITAEAMRKFGVKIDNEANRIVYPVYDADFNLIGVKGRTRYENYKLLGIPKYMNFYKIGTVDYFQGMKEQYENIISSKKIIIFEGIKSVMKADSWGYHNCVSAETSCLNDLQVKQLLKLGVKEVTICFDSDVDIKKIITCTKMLKRFCNVYVVQDRKHLLGEKESPTDKGRQIFETLLAERRKL